MRSICHEDVLYIHLLLSFKTGPPRALRCSIISAIHYGRREVALSYIVNSLTGVGQGLSCSETDMRWLYTVL
jgi:hypothetical protein